MDTATGGTTQHGADGDRHETPIQRLDRNWADLLQELRVVLTGVQLLTGFLLTLPFQNRFTTLESWQRTVFLAAVSASILATALLQAPVSVHRALFRRHERARTVLVAHRLSVAGIAFLAVAIVGVSLLVFSVIAGDAAGVVAGVVTALVLVSLWVVLPRSLRRHETPAGPSHE